MRLSSRQLVFLFFLATLACNVSTVAAFPHVWFSGTGGNFVDPGRWVPMSVPGPASDVFFVQPSSYVVTFPAETTVGSNSLTVQGGDVTFEFLDIDSFYSVTNDAVLGGSGGPSSLTVNTGTLEVLGQFDILSGATLLGSQGPIIGSVSAGGTVNVANGGAIRGRLTVTSNVEVNNHGLIAPGTGSAIGTITVQSGGDFEQFADGTLEIKIRQASSASDTLVYAGFGGAGNVILGGQLNVPFINGYVPVDNDTFTFVHTFLPGNNVIGQFDSVSVPGLNNGLAARVDYTPTTTAITFVTATIVPFSSGNLVQPPGFNSWDDTSLWNGTVPNSTSVVNVLNQQNYDGKIRLDPLSSESRNAFTHQASLGGLTNNMTLSVPGETNFTAVDSLNVNNLGVIELDGGTVHSKLVKVNPGGQIVGNGFIDGNVQLGSVSGPGEAILSPGFSAGEITIEENLTVASNGVVEIEIFDEADFDKVTVIQNANLGGMLSVDLSGAAPATLIGEEFEVLTAGDVNQTFADIVVEGAPDYFVQPDYSELSLSLLVWGDGDMNCDGDYTADDVEKFAMALTNPIAYFSAFEVFGEDSGDMNDDGFFDFDDIDEFSEIDFGGLTAEEVVTYLLSQTAAVPEPSAALLMIAACGLVMGGGARQLCKRSSILG